MKIKILGDTTLEIHPAFPLLCIVLLLTQQSSLVWIMLLVLVLHELGHVTVALLLGVRVRAIELMPFGGAAKLEGWRQLSAWQASLIALGGPAVNLLLAMTAIFCVHYHLVDVADVAQFVRCNVTLMAFNLLPALPMDGGRLCSAWLGALIGTQRALHIFSALGVLLGIMALTLSVWGITQGVLNLTLLLAGAYLVYAALQERNTPVYTQLHRNINSRTQLQNRGALPAHHWIVRTDMQIEKLANQLNANSYHDFKVVDENMKPIGKMDEGMLLRNLMDRPGITVGEAIQDSKH